MEYVTLGRTGLRASVAGLGCGGHSRLGTAKGESMTHAAGIVEHALDLGINFIDTAAAYGTEPAVGQAIKGQREKVIVSTKAGVGEVGGFKSADEVVASLDNSLKTLRTDYIDIFNLHGVTLNEYSYAIEAILPVLLEQQAAGKIRYLGITEAFIRDPQHSMLQTALADDHFDVIMVGFNMLNPSARHCVFPITRQKGVATQIMFAVRRALSQPEALRELIGQMTEEGLIEGVKPDDALGFIEGSLVEAAYRFCRHEPGADVILTGTGTAAHLTANVQSILAPPLPQEVQDLLRVLFGHVDSVSGN